MPILAYLSGSTGPLTQISRIKEGMALLSEVELTDYIGKADFIYVNNPPFDEYVKMRQEGKLKPTCKLIFTVLDIPLHLLDNGYNPYENIDALLQADAICTISKYVQSQVHSFFGLKSYVVGNPVKDVTPDIRLSGRRPYPFRALLAGRTSDPNKHHLDISIPALIMAGFQEKEVAIIGGENVGWGTNLGVVSDKTLNELYNSVDFVMFPSTLEGLGLPAAEAMICGAIPIVTSSLTTKDDLLIPLRWGCYPSAKAVAYRLRQLIDNPEVRSLDKETSLQIGQTLVSSLNKLNVATKILRVYQSLNSLNYGHSTLF
jgi:glycosyltransferase involved in cell wall biosynthesis